MVYFSGFQTKKINYNAQLKSPTFWGRSNSIVERGFREACWQLEADPSEIA